LESEKVNKKRLIIVGVITFIVAGIAGCKKPTDTTREVSASPRRIEKVLPKDRQGSKRELVASDNVSRTSKTDTRSATLSSQPSEAEKKSASNESKSYTLYTIKKGDTLMSIARKFYGDASRYKDIARANNIANPSKIYAGQVIKIPR